MFASGLLITFPLDMHFIKVPPASRFNSFELLVYMSKFVVFSETPALSFYVIIISLKRLIIILEASYDE